MRISFCAAESRWNAGWAPLAAGALYLAFAGLAVSLSAGGASCTLCHFKLLTGLPCPTCGATRMVLALLAGHFVDAWRLNPLLFLGLVTAVAWLAMRCTGRRVVVQLSRPGRCAVLTSLAVAVLANWAYLIVVGR